MSVRSIRGRLAKDHAVGAGNVISTLMSIGAGLDDPALSFDTDVDGHPAWQALSVRELDRLVACRVGALRAQGVGPRDAVAVYVTSAANTVLSFFALARIGAIPALVNPNVPADTAAEYIRRLRAVGVLTDQAHRRILDEYDPGTPLLSDVDELGAGDPAAAGPVYQHHSDDPVAITHSSGTTGMPKAVVHSHSSLYAAIRYRLTLPRPQGSERMLSALPAPHAATLIAVNLALSLGGELLVLSGQSGAQVLDVAQRWRPRAVLGFAATWTELAKSDLASRDLDSVAFWWNTGDCAHEAHIRKLIAVGQREGVTLAGRHHTRGSVFVDGLGSTEMGHSHFHIAHSLETSRYGRCIGKPHQFVDAAVLGPDGQEVPNGTVGELGTRSPTLALGYWNDSVTTYRTRVRGYFLTGDLVYRDDEGYFYHMDRAVDSADYGDGTRLYTAMSEERVLAACPEVLDCTVVAVNRDGKVVTDVLIQLDPATDPTIDRTDRIRAALGDQVAATMRRVVVVGEGNIPLGPTGKVRKFQLREAVRPRSRGAGRQRDGRNVTAGNVTAGNVTAGNVTAGQVTQAVSSVGVAP